MGAVRKKRPRGRRRRNEYLHWAARNIDVSDRLSLTLCLAVIAHLVAILGVGFRPEGESREHTSVMEVVLVRKTTPTAPPDEEVQALAQANLNEQGGKSPDDVLPTLPEPAPPVPVEDMPMSAVPSAEMPDMPVPEQLVQPQESLQDIHETVAEVAEQPASPPEPVMQQQVAEAALVPVDAVVEEQEPEAAAAAPAQPTPPSPVPPNLDTRLEAADLITSSYQIAALSAEIKRKLDERAKRPRRQFVSASTREYKYAAYMEAWRQKVERVGNLNYPREARRRSLTGSLILDVALYPDGSLEAITVRRSSGNRILDDAAIYIVTLAAPFAPFPEGIREEVDILHITRTWQFLNNDGFR